MNKMGGTPCSLRHGTKIPINSGLVSTNFDPQVVNPRRRVNFRMRSDGGGGERGGWRN
jgi:hypothetical protein